MSRCNAGIYRFINRNTIFFISSIKSNCFEPISILGYTVSSVTLASLIFSARHASALVDGILKGFIFCVYLIHLASSNTPVQLTVCQLNFLVSRSVGFLQLQTLRLQRQASEVKVFAFSHHV